MAISRSLRFEIFRRDNFTCRYCGASAPDVSLEIDHVIPQTLGGSDEPSNLVTACSDCNGGKAAVHPDASVVEDVARDALRWKAAIEQAAALRSMERDLLAQDVERWIDHWAQFKYTTTERVKVEHAPPPAPPLERAWRGCATGLLLASCRPVGIVGEVLQVQIERPTPGFQEALGGFVQQQFASKLGQQLSGYEMVEGWDGPVPLAPAPTYERRERQHSVPFPAGFRATVERFLELGVSIDELVDHIDKAMAKKMTNHDGRFNYFCGCGWRSVSALQEDARRILESETDAPCG